MRLWTIINVLNEMHHLPRCVKSVEDVFFEKVEYITHVFIDGAYEGFEAKGRISTDGTRDFAEKHGVLLSAPDVTECEKRTIALRHIDHHAQRGDWLLYIDADEEITSLTSWPERVGYFAFTRTTGRPIEYGRCRLYLWEPGLEFKHRHYELYDVRGELVASLEDAPDYQVVGEGLHHETFPRPKAKQNYYRHLRHIEHGEVARA